MANEIVRKGFVNKNGEKVQLLPAPHEHQISDVEGLNDALAGLSDSFEALDNGKQDKLTFDNTPTAGSTNPVTSGGVKTALDGKAPANYVPYIIEKTTSEGTSRVLLDGEEIEFFIEDVSGDDPREVTATLNFSKMQNFARALRDPDTTPTANSDNLVTSGGVKRALDNKTSISHEDMDSIVKVEVKHVGDDEYDQAKVIGKDRIVMGVGTDAEDGSVIIDANNIANLHRALQTPDNAPTENSDKFVTSGGVKTALDGKAPANYVPYKIERTTSEGTSRVLVDGEEIEFFIEDLTGDDPREVTAALNFSKMPNFARALRNPDTTPTANSDNLVTSGGVKAAVDAADAVHYKRQFYYGSASDEISVADLVSGHTYAVRVRVQISHFSDVFAETGINFCGLEGSTPNVTTAIFRYFSLETDVEGSYEHFISVLAYKTSSFEPI